jgi:hypothetical protein
MNIEFLIDSAEKIAMIIAKLEENDVCLLVINLIREKLEI